MIKQVIASRIQQQRLKLGLTQDNIACALQISPQAVSKWERGENAPDIEFMPLFTNDFH